MKGRIHTQPRATPESFSAKLKYIMRDNSAIMLSRNLDRSSDYASQMDAVVAKGTGRVRNPLFHISISWPRKDVSRRDAFRAVHHCIERLGASGCQWVAATHQDTANYHCHVVINRIQPNNGLAWPASFSKLKLSRACSEFEAEESRTITNAPPQRAADFELYTGMNSLITWTRQNVLPRYTENLRDGKMEKWNDVHSLCASRGLEYSNHGSLIDRTGKRPFTVKASAVSTLLKLETLTGRMGPYAAKANSIKVVAEGYGKALGLCEIPTERVRKPNVMPMFERWVRERRAYEHDRERVSLLRKRFREAAQRQLDRIASESRNARQLVFRMIEDSKYRRGMMMLVTEMIQYKRRRTERQLAEVLKSVVSKEPPEQFLPWLQNLADQHDAEAQLAIREWRDVSTAATHKSRPAIKLASAKYVEYSASAAFRYAVDTEKLDLHIVGVVDALKTDAAFRSFEQKLQRSIRDTCRALSDEDLEGTDELFNDIVHRIPEAMKTDKRALLVARAASLFPVALQYQTFGLGIEVGVLGNPIVSLSPNLASIEELSALIGFKDRAADQIHQSVERYVPINRDGERSRSSFSR